MSYPYASRNTRASRAADLASSGAVHPVGKPKKQRFLVDSQSQHGVTYLVSLRFGHTCECPDYVHRQETCKHIQAAQQYQRSIPVETLTTSALLNAQSAITALMVSEPGKARKKALKVYRKFFTMLANHPDKGHNIPGRILLDIFRLTNPQ